MSRAIAWTEKAGVPAVGVVCHGFEAPARIVAAAEEMPAPRLLVYPPPNMGVHSREEVHRCAEGLVEALVAALTGSAKAAEKAAAGARETPKDIVFRGNLDEVNEYVREQVWSDGLPVMPPTRAAVEAMLAHTDRAPDELLGILPPRKLAATVWKVAVNAVMAGCRPEYMPVLVALTEAVADARFGLEHAGSTQGWTPIVILNGPIAKALRFNSGQGLLRPQHQANITVARFLRLLMVNVAGYRLGETDMATFGRNYYPVLVEAEDESPWEPLSVDRGYAAGTNLVTVQSAEHAVKAFLSEGPAESHLDTIADELARDMDSTLVSTVHIGREVTPVLALTPLVAGIIAKAGYSKLEAKRYIYERALVPASRLEEKLQRFQAGMTLADAVKQGFLSARFAGSDDPGRRVPVLRKPEELMIVVCGSPNRNRSIIVGQVGLQGLNTSREIAPKR